LPENRLRFGELLFGNKWLDIELHPQQFDAPDLFSIYLSAVR